MAGMRFVPWVHLREPARPAWFETPALGGLLTMRVEDLAEKQDLILRARQRRASRRMAASSGRRLSERGDDGVDDVLDQDAVFAFGHDADHRLGAGGADQEAAMAVESLLARGDRRLDVVIIE